VLLVKDIDLRKIFWISIITNPIPNSTADKTKKKKVKDKKLTLSYSNPIDNESTYSVIHSISAVNSKCSAVFTFTIIVTSIKKKISENRFRSPIYIN
jgi:hypothetical protein